MTEAPAVVCVGGIFLNLDHMVSAEWSYADFEGSRQLHFFLYFVNQRHYRFHPDRGGRELELLLRQRALPAPAASQ